MYSKIDVISDDKHSFFKKMHTQELDLASHAGKQRKASEKNPSDTDDTEQIPDEVFIFAKNLAKEQDYAFLATNEMLIREEFDHLFTLLSANGEYPDIFWYYCYYCATMLQNYHRAYGQNAKADEYKEYREKIKQRCEDPQKKWPQQKIKDEEFVAVLKKAFIQGVKDLISLPTKLSKIRDWVSYLNMYRIYWFFCRTILSKSFLLAKELNWLDKLSSFLGKPIDANKIIKILEKPNAGLKVLSVAFFGIRFILNGAMLILHTMNEKDFKGKTVDEDKRTMTWDRRLYLELYKRHAIFLNDTAWGMVNLLTNYNTVFHISDPAAAWIVAGFLFFDLAMWLWNRELAYREHLTKQAQYDINYQYYQSLLKDGVDEEGNVLTTAKRTLFMYQLDIINKQKELESDKFRAKNDKFNFNAVAAVFLAAGFTASMLLTPPAAILFCYVVGTFGVAMYLSSDSYQNYKEKSYLYDRAFASGTNLEAALAAKNAARNAFYFTLAKNVIIPTLFIATYAICWQAGLALTVLYLGYQLYSAYSKHAASKEQARIEGNLTPSKDNRSGDDSSYTQLNAQDEGCNSPLSFTAV